jgi:hypothetical protein
MIFSKLTITPRIKVLKIFYYFSGSFWTFFSCGFFNKYAAGRIEKQ